MRVERTVHNPVPAAEVYRMSTSAAFQEQKCRESGAVSWDVRVADDPGGPVVRTRRRLAPGDLPRFLRRFAPGGLTATETVRWRPAGDDGTRTGELSVDFHGAPVSMAGVVRILPDGDRASTVVVDVQFRAHVPLLGARLERIAGPMIVRMIDAEEATGRAWTAARR